MQSERDFGTHVAGQLKAGSRDDYELVQKLAVRAPKTENWIDSDMLMQITFSSSSIVAMTCRLLYYPALDGGIGAIYQSGWQASCDE